MKMNNNNMNFNNNIMKYYNFFNNMNNNQFNNINMNNKNFNCNNNMINMKNNFGIMPNNMIMNNINSKTYLNQSKLFNTNYPYNIQFQIYNNLMTKNFKSTPNYSNGLEINNSNISENNKLLLKKLIKITKYSLITPLEIIYKEQYGLFTKTTKEREKCPICLCEFYDSIIEENPQKLSLKPINSYISQEIDTVKLFKCEDHFYHIECLSNYIQQKDGFKCAICQKIYGIIKGNMPPGRMTARIDHYLKCAGYYNYETIVIDYSFKDGYLDGKHYSGTFRTSYLPNSKEGREVLGLLKVAFDRKLTFVVGTSVTTGQKNTVIWNGIHHKTSTTGGPIHYGYPDPTYFNRVTEELASKGVNKIDFKKGELEEIATKLIHKY